MNYPQPIIKHPRIWFKQKYPEVSNKYGEAVKLNVNGGGILCVQQLNEDFFAATLGSLGSSQIPTVFVTREDRFYSYDSELGIYVSKSENQIITELSTLLQKCADECNEKGSFDTSSLRFQCSKAGQLNGVIKKAKGQLHVSEDYFATNLEDYIACKNGMLRLVDNVLLPFHAEFRRRNKLSVTYDPTATCPIFLNTLMSQALDNDDIEFLQKWTGLAT